MAISIIPNPKWYPPRPITIIAHEFIGWVNQLIDDISISTRRSDNIARFVLKLNGRLKLKRPSQGSLSSNHDFWPLAQPDDMLTQVPKWETYVKICTFSVRRWERRTAALWGTERKHQLCSGRPSGQHVSTITQWSAVKIFSLSSNCRNSWVAYSWISAVDSGLALAGSVHQNARSAWEEMTV